LRDEGEGPKENFISDRPAGWFAARFRDDALSGGHVIQLGPGNTAAAREALATWPGGLQIGGGITPANAAEWIDAGASHIIVTFALAMVVFLTVIAVGFAKHGTHFLGLFVPGGAPALLVPFLVVIEVISFLSRPISLGMRLFANMLAGHIALKVFAGFVVSLGALGIGGILGATLPLGMIVALTALEFLVAFLQAYVFTILTCVYLNDALHPGH
jgi:ATP synthase subunit 6